MIHVDRNRVQEPSILKFERVLVGMPARFRRSLPSAVRRYADRPFEGQPRKPPGDSVLHARTVIRTLLELFHGKCAFCESKMGDDAPIEAGRFRPGIETVALDGTLFPDHYSWLVGEWTNLYLICPMCNKMKGSRFPIRGPRADFGALGEELLAEQPLLLDPCTDYPEEHLLFDESGTVASGTEQGRMTIEVFGLNRTELVEARRKAYERLRKEWEASKRYFESGEPVPDELSPEALADPAQPFAGMRNQFLIEWLELAPTPVRERLVEPSWEGLARGVEARKAVLSQEARKEAFEEFRAYQRDQEDYSLESRTHEERYFARTRVIERIEIRNFRAIEELTLHLSNPESDWAPWLMLLGENGTGKSSVLQAVALALVGDRYRARLPEAHPIRPADVLRYDCESGSVKVFLTGSPDPIELTYRQGSDDFKSNRPDPQVLLLAYGATRLLPRAGVEPAEGTTYAHADNLFNPFVPLRDATEWLLELRDEELFQHIERALKGLLMLQGTDRLVRDPPDVIVETSGTDVPLSQLSDGYQTVLALTTDIMAVMIDRWKAMDVAEGIVLLDEIGAHLHPRWKMRIVTSLRQVFPRVQFLVTTHNPLCLRGLLENEVVVMRRTPGNKIVTLTDLPPVEGMRVDQLLTSEHFGLDSTLDPEIDQMFQEYYRLLSARQRSEAEEEQLGALRAQLEKLDLMGSTRRERLMLEAVDQYLAEEAGMVDLDGRRELKEETRRQVSEMWSRLEREEGV